MTVSPTARFLGLIGCSSEEADAEYMATAVESCYEHILHIGEGVDLGGSGA